VARKSHVCPSTREEEHCSGCAVARKNDRCAAQSFRLPADFRFEIGLVFVSSRTASKLRRLRRRPEELAVRLVSNIKWSCAARPLRGPRPPPLGGSGFPLRLPRARRPGASFGLLRFPACSLRCAAAPLLLPSVGGGCRALLGRAGSCPSVRVAGCPFARCCACPGAKAGGRPPGSRLRGSPAPRPVAGVSAALFLRRSAPPPPSGLAVSARSAGPVGRAAGAPALPFRLVARAFCRRSRPASRARAPAEWPRKGTQEPIPGFQRGEKPGSCR
jgi:hypothetical protein